MFHQRRQHKICFAKTFERSKKICRVFLSLRQVPSYQRNGKKVKVSDKKIKKYREFYEEEKRRHEEALQRYQEDHMDEMDIINLHKRCNKTDTKAATKTGEKAALRAPRSGYHLFLR